MKIEYDRETDSLYIRFRDEERTIVDSSEIEPGIVCDFAEDGQIVGLDFEHASRHVDLESISFGSQQLMIS